MDVFTATTADAALCRSTASPNQSLHGIWMDPMFMTPATEVPGWTALTTSARLSPNSAATFARSSNVQGDAPVMRR